jgi:hypothetical protein
MSEKKQYFGKYRGAVINNIDPMQTGKKGEFKQNFTLTRNGLVSITPGVLV